MVRIGTGREDGRDFHSGGPAFRAAAHLLPILTPAAEFPATPLARARRPLP